MKRTLFSLMFMYALQAQAAQDPVPLPVAENVRAALMATPSVQAALRMNDYAGATARALDAGPHEWMARAGYAQRNEVDVKRYNEADVGIERGLRWWWKGNTDHKIGETGMQVADAAIADAWHEEARTLLSQWFEVLRSMAIVDHLQRQLLLVDEQVRDVSVRVDKGQTRVMDLKLSENERAMAQARLLQAQRDLNAARTQFSLRYPAIPLAEKIELPQPQVSSEDAAHWIGKIVGHNHEIELAKAETERAGLQADRARQERLPDPIIGTRYGYERGGDERVMGVSVSFPIGGGLRAATAEQTRAKAGEVAQRQREVELKVETSARTVAMDAKSRFDLWQRYEQVSSTADRSAESIGRGYQLGEATLADVLLARRQALEAALGSAQARADAWQASSRLQLDAHEIWAYEEHHLK